MERTRARAAADGARSDRERDELVIPRIAEQAFVTTKSVEVDRVRVDMITETRNVEVEALASREDLTIERIPIGREVDHPPAVRTEGDTLVIPVLEEIVVVEKRLVLREELRVTKTRTEEPQKMRVPVRSQRARVTRAAAPPLPNERQPRNRR